MKTPTLSQCSQGICSTLDRLGLPHGSRWRALILFMRSIKEYDIYSAEQKRRVQALVMQVLKERDFTEEKFQELARKNEEILSEPWRRKLREALSDLSHLIRESRTLILKRKGELEVLESSTVEGLQTGREIDLIVDDIRRSFQDVFAMMEEDADKLSLLSRTDSLTGLGNRRAFDDDLAQAVEHARKQGKPLAMLMADVDHFKVFNDNFGHPIGDQALAAVASVIRDCKNQCANSGLTAFAARYGGEEFAVVVSGMDQSQALGLGENIRSRIETYNFVIRGLDGRITSSGIRLTVSVGVACLNDQWPENPAQRLVAAADEALYAAKAGGRNQVVPG